MPFTNTFVPPNQEIALHAHIFPHMVHIQYMENVFGKIHIFSIFKKKKKKCFVFNVQDCHAGNMLICVLVCREQRVTGIMVFILTGVSVFMAPILKVKCPCTLSCI